MNIRQLEYVIAGLEKKFKPPPIRWNDSQVTAFCEFSGLYWAIGVLTSQQFSKQRSQTHSVDQRPTQKQNRYLAIQQLSKQIPLLDACIFSLEHIMQVCEDFEIAKMISTSMDINLYYQIQKLKIWSFLLLQYQNMREQLRKGGKSIYQQLLTQIEMYIKSIYVDNVKFGHISYLEFSNLDAMIEQKAKRKRANSIFIDQSLLNLIYKHLQYMPNETPLFWDLDLMRNLLMLIKQEDYFKILFQNQIDGFVLLILINPPFKDDNLFLKCLLISQENTQLTNVTKARQQMISHSMSAANRYYQFSAFVHLLHNILQLMNLTIYRTVESFRDYELHLGQRQVRSIQWISLYYFPQSKYVNESQKLRKISSIKSNSKSQSSYYPSVDLRRPSKSNGEIDVQSLQRTQTMNTRTDSKVRVSTDTMDDTELKLITPDKNNTYLFFPDSNHTQNWIDIKQINAITEFAIVEDEEDVRGSIIMNQQTQIEQDIQESVTFSPENKSPQIAESVTFSPERGSPEKGYLQPSSVICPQLIELQQSVMMNESVLMPNRVMQQSEYMMPVIQKQQPVGYFNINKQIIPSTSIREQILERIRKLTLTPSFCPFSQRCTLMKLRVDQQLKEKTVLIFGASIGRNEENTFSFTDHYKISGKHARIYHENKTFYLKDLGSKGGTFIKVNSQFVCEKDMTIYVGNKFAFKIQDIVMKDQEAIIQVKFEKEQNAHYKCVVLKEGKKLTIGKDPTRNDISFQLSQCHKLLSPKHLEIVLDYDKKSQSLQVMINDLGGQHGTWLRLSEKQVESVGFMLQKDFAFNLSFELFFRVTELSSD